ncbi:hypothetical protein FRC14_006738 [Serendipita sp. 396]|nr:hypothetical protein FRC14_006738 [Serendipita sp. 396]KAG8799497.1 hypothetical protein FRC16_004979 [Serendipita sp. 398]KAG8848602.1 hypothetical protein FRB91_010678 [Serendipita sp. 411]KAG8865951.1 hypothetical protein FRC20_009241 [Serendipita sp. 405]
MECIGNASDRPCRWVRLIRLQLALHQDREVDMTTFQQATTGSTSPGAENGIKEFILTKERQLKTYQEDIENEEDKLGTVEKAIESLEKALPEARRSLEIQRQNLKALSKICAGIESLSATFVLPPSGEESSRGLCVALQSTLAKQTRVGASVTEPLVTFTKDGVAEIARTTRRLEAELWSWRFSRDIHQKSLDHARSVFKELQADLYTAKRTFWKIPTEVWVDIFRWRTQGELDEFISSHTARPFQPPATLISRVCRLWRNIVSEEPDLWCHIAMHPCAAWSNNKLELLKFSLDMAKRRKVFISDLCQPLVWAGQYYDNGTYMYPSLVDPIMISGSYEITLVTSSDNSPAMTKITTLPFKNPDKLTLVNRPGRRYGHLFNYITSFTNLRSLSIVDPTPHSLDTLQLAGIRFPNLIHLSLEAETLSYPFRPHLLLPSTLQTLQIRHSGQSPFPAVQTSVLLPQLTTLEVTPPLTRLFQAVNVRSLQQLTLYGPKGTATIAPTPPPNGSRLRLETVVQMEFRSWLNPILVTGLTACGAVNTLRDWGARMPRVRSLKFVDSHVDGVGLLDLLKSWRSSTESSTWPDLSEITIDCCTGLTRSDCESLKEFVEKVNVFV